MSDDENSDEFDLDFVPSFITKIVGSAALLYTQQHHVKEPFHTSALTGESWVLELLTRHPERIRSELGVHLHVFHKLLDALKGIGYSNSRHITLEEQLAIFLYGCVTSLSVRHLGERFQRSNDTISK